MSKVNKKTPERGQRRCSGVFIVNFEHISHLVLVSVVNFEHVLPAGYIYFKMCFGVGVKRLYQIIRHSVQLKMDAFLYVNSI